jgi:hypothetical protein
VALLHTQFHEYIQRLVEKVQNLEQDNMNFVKETKQRFHLIENENEKLKEKLAQIKPIHIENINYKIQELDVKELKGTLNIGMTALTDAEKLKEWIGESEGEDIQFNDMEQKQAEKNEADWSDGANS